LTEPDAPIVFYFDFVSPFAHVGAVAIERLGKRLGRRVEWRPVLIGVTILKIMGMQPLPQYPLKGPYLERDLERMSAYFQVPVRQHRLGPVSPVVALRAFLLLKAEDEARAKRFAQAVFRTLWVEGLDIGAADTVLGLAGDSGADRVALTEKLGLESTKALLRDAVDAAVAAGVFGVPSFVADGEMFWGNDHLWMLEHWLTKHRFES
jgi:2-hydroxychromene-2-carboxylate isomerase